MLGILKLGEDKKYFAKCALIGSLCITVAYALFVIDPLQSIIDNQLSVHDSTFLYNLFKRPPLDVFIAVTVFNITNVEAFLNGSTTQIHVAEVGPFVYQEFLEHLNTTFNEDGSMSYVPHRTHKFIPERSIGHPKDFLIHVPNIPLLGMSSHMNKWSIFGAMTLSSLAMSLHLEPILNMTVDEYLWGYDDPLVKFGSQIIPSFINIEKFGLLDRMFDDGEDVVQMHLPNATSTTTTKVSPRDYSIQNWDSRFGLKQWHYDEEDHMAPKNTPCNTLQGTYDGTLFPKGFQEDFRVYRKAFCRTLQLKHTHSDRVDGINVEWFGFDELAFHNNGSDPESSCYCDQDRCLKQGLGDISPCYYNIPLAVSLPHYLRSDDSFQERVVGLSPSEDKHGSHFGLQPQFGVPMSVRIRVQLNLIVESTRFNHKIKPFDGTASPLLWLEISVDGLPVYLKLLYHFAFNVMPYVQAAATYGLFLVGPLYILLGLIELFSRRTSVSVSESIGTRGNIMRLAVPLASSSSSAGLTKDFVRYTPIIGSFRGKEDV